jgi:hypothetical protein
MAGRGQQIGNAVAHESAADDSDLLFLRCRHFFLDARGEPRFAPHVVSQRSKWPIHTGEMVMPALLWVAFWSSMMAAATCLGESPHPIHAETARDGNRGGNKGGNRHGK